MTENQTATYPEWVDRHLQRGDQTAITKLSAKSHTTVSKALRGKSRPDPRLAFNASCVLDVTAVELLARWMAHHRGCDRAWEAFLEADDVWVDEAITEEPIETGRRLVGGSRG